MRTILSLIAFSFLPACLYSYSAIDASEWTTHQLEGVSRKIRLESPGGSAQLDQSKMYSSESTTGLLELHYDMLSGPTLYGTPYGETRLFVYELKTDFSGIDEFVSRRAELDCESYVDKDRFAACIIRKRKLTDHKGIVRDSWHHFEYLSEDDKMIEIDYILYVGSGRFLNIKGVVSSKAFERQKVRENRLKMIDDIFQSTTVSSAESDT